jgi:hypothetical protein
MRDIGWHSAVYGSLTLDGSMNYQRHFDETHARSVRIVESEIASETWQRVDLEATLKRIRDSIGSRAPAHWRAAATTSACFPGRERDLIPQPTPPFGNGPGRRVPDSDIVVIGRAACAREQAAKAGERTRGGRRVRRNWRNIFFLAVLAATLAGAYYSGRANAVQRVIVVPDVASRSHVIT